MERETLFKKLVNKLGNWQRNQWARAGYPGLREKDPDKVEPYTRLSRVFRQPIGRPQQ